MADLDPFADNAFINRLQKLLSMLGSGQAAEAEAARRKLLEHLAQHRLSLTDVAMHLGDASPRASFTQGARELSLERQLAIARDAKQEAAAEALTAMARVHELELALQRATFDVGAALQGHARARTFTAIACFVAVVALLVAVVPRLAAVGRGPAAHQTASATLAPDDPVLGEGELRLAPGERRGVAAVQDLAVRLTPHDDAGVRAFLNAGEHVVIVQTVRVGPQTWLLIRSGTGSGWVRAGDVLH